MDKILSAGEIVRKVVLAYEAASQRVLETPYFKTGIPREGSKTFLNCLEVFEWCRDHGISLEDYFPSVFSTFSSKWCVRQFKKPIPPFTIASSMKVLLRIDEGLKSKPLRSTQDGLIQEIAEIIQRHPGDQWENILENVYSYLPYEMRREVRTILNKGAA